ncbi:MAG: hypothetical protein HQM09_24625 [Candidatus Riflebacteria bacterium]|nr:hypothetical protein [Candidatus Riflebacteria bacterium]
MDSLKTIETTTTTIRFEVTAENPQYLGFKAGDKVTFAFTNGKKLKIEGGEILLALLPNDDQDYHFLYADTFPRGSGRSLYLLDGNENEYNFEKTFDIIGYMIRPTSEAYRLRYPVPISKAQRIARQEMKEEMEKERIEAMEKAKLDYQLRHLDGIGRILWHVEQAAAEREKKRQETAFADPSKL